MTTKPESNYYKRTDSIKDAAIRMMGLEAASTMRQSSSISASSHRRLRSTMYFVLCVTACAILLLSNSVGVSAHNEPRIDDIKFEKTRETLSLVLPHDTYPGFNVHSLAQLTSTGRSSLGGALLATASTTVSPAASATSLLSNAAHAASSFYTMNKKYSKYFTVLDNGMLITTSDISPLINKPVNLLVMEETPNTTLTHQLQLIVMDRKDMLQFPTANLDMTGEVSENQPRGTRVQAIPMLWAYATSGGKRIITYSIVAGNDHGAFTLQNSKTHELGDTMSIKHSKTVGVWLVTNKPLDREYQNKYYLTIQASDSAKVDKALSKVTINILDENDNRPVFTQPHFKFSITGNKTYNLEGNSTVTWQRFNSIGRVEAKDADGDKVAYKLLTPNNMIVIVPQTGELLLTDEPDKTELLLKVEAHDLRTPSLSSKHPADVLIEFVTPDLQSMVMQHLEHDDEEYQHAHSHRRDKRRVTRAVRPTKRIEFNEADGDTEGKSVFQLEKETAQETFKIRDENPWVTVEPNGAVRVKKKWDYEELGAEKTIDFWVIITNSGQMRKF